MGSLFHKSLHALQLFGFNPSQLATTIRYLPAYAVDTYKYWMTARGSRFPLRLSELYPVLGEGTKSAGVIEGHYFHQDLWAARKVYHRAPTHHVDVGSRIDGFVAHILTFMPVTVVDIRPLQSVIPGLTFVQDDATCLTMFEDESIESLSSLHVVEHLGLGRYGDPIDIDAPFKAMAAFNRVLKRGGYLYFSVPLGVERVRFNAHRVFAPATVLQAFATLRLVSFAAVDDEGNFHSEAEPEMFSRSMYALGLFEFTKP